MNNHEIPNFETPSSFVTYRLAKLQSSLNTQATSILKAHVPLSLVEWRIVQILRMFEHASLSEIAEHVEMDKGQLSRKIKGMMEKGLLECERDKEDKRVQHLRLTKKALELSNEVMPVMEARQKLLLAEISPEDLRVFNRVVDKLEAASKIRNIK